MDKFSRVSGYPVRASFFSLLDQTVEEEVHTFYPKGIIIKQKTMAQQDQNQRKEGSTRGFASMNPEQQRAIARKGGAAVSENREHMAAIGRKGGEAVSGNREHMAQIGRKGGQVVSENREHMAEIGRKGGESSGNSRSNRNHTYRNPQNSSETGR